MYVLKHCFNLTRCLLLCDIILLRRRVSACQVCANVSCERIDDRNVLIFRRVQRRSYLYNLVLALEKTI